MAQTSKPRIRLSELESVEIGQANLAGSLSDTAAAPDAESGAGSLAAPAGRSRSITLSGELDALPEGVSPSIAAMLAEPEPEPKPEMVAAAEPPPEPQVAAAPLPKRSSRAPLVLLGVLVAAGLAALVILPRLEVPLDPQVFADAPPALQAVVAPQTRIDFVEPPPPPEPEAEAEPTRTETRRSSQNRPRPSTEVRRGDLF